MIRTICGVAGTAALAVAGLTPAASASGHHHGNDEVKVLVCVQSHEDHHGDYGDHHDGDYGDHGDGDYGDHSHDGDYGDHGDGDYGDHSHDGDYGDHGDGDYGDHSHDGDYGDHSHDGDYGDHHDGDYGDHHDGDYGDHHDGDYGDHGHDVSSYVKVRAKTDEDRSWARISSGSCRSFELSYEAARVRVKAWPEHSDDDITFRVFGKDVEQKRVNDNRVRIKFDGDARHPFVGVGISVEDSHGDYYGHHDDHEHDGYYR